MADDWRNHNRRAYAHDKPSSAMASASAASAPDPSALTAKLATPGSRPSSPTTCPLVQPDAAPQLAETRALQGHDREVKVNSSLAVSTDGRLVVTGSNDSTTKLTGVQVAMDTHAADCRGRVSSQLAQGKVQGFPDMLAEDPMHRCGKFAPTNPASGKSAASPAIAPHLPSAASLCTIKTTSPILDLESALTAAGNRQTGTKGSRSAETQPGARPHLEQSSTVGTASRTRLQVVRFVVTKDHYATKAAPTAAAPAPAAPAAVAAPAAKLAPATHGDGGALQRGTSSQLPPVCPAAATREQQELYTSPLLAPVAGGSAAATASAAAAQATAADAARLQGEITALNANKPTVTSLGLQYKSGRAVPAIKSPIKRLTTSVSKKGDNQKVTSAGQHNRGQLEMNGDSIAEHNRRIAAKALETAVIVKMAPATAPVAAPVTKADPILVHPTQPEDPDASANSCGLSTHSLEGMAAGTSRTPLCPDPGSEHENKKSSQQPGKSMKAFVASQKKPFGSDLPRSGLNAGAATVASPRFIAAATTGSSTERGLSAISRSISSCMSANSSNRHMARVPHPTQTAAPPHMACPSAR